MCLILSTPGCVQPKHGGRRVSVGADEYVKYDIPFDISFTDDFESEVSLFLEGMTRRCT